LCATNLTYLFSLYVPNDVGFFHAQALASTLKEEELADLKDQFDAIDVDKSGSISIEEMRHALAKDLPWRLKGPRVLEIIQAIDSNTDGLVDFEEFVAATLHIHQMAELDSERWGLRCQAAFSKFDLDGDGYITPDELRMVSFNSCSVFMLVYVATSYLVNEVILSTEDIISYTKKENPRFSHMLVDAPHSRGLSHTYRRPV
jgi:Ca2+-binding EF-hand superfamily protein